MTESDRPMPTNPQPPSAEPLRASLSDADDRIRLNHWMPPQQGIFPRITHGSTGDGIAHLEPIGFGSRCRCRKAASGPPRIHSVTLPTWLGIPGLRHTLGLARWWHFSVNLLWLINGVAFYVLLFSTDQWRRLVPMTWEVFRGRALDGDPICLAEFSGPRRLDPL